MPEEEIRKEIEKQLQNRLAHIEAEWMWAHIIIAAIMTVNLILTVVQLIVRITR